MVVKAYLILHPIDTAQVEKLIPKQKEKKEKEADKGEAEDKSKEEEEKEKEKNKEREKEKEKVEREEELKRFTKEAIYFVGIDVWNRPKAAIDEFLGKY